MQHRILIQNNIVPTYFNSFFTNVYVKNLKLSEEDLSHYIIRLKLFIK